MTSKTFKATIVRDGSMCFIPLTFDPRAVFGKVRVPVKVTVNGYTYRSTIAAMGGRTCLPLRKSNREAAGLTGGETIEVRLDLDSDPRTVIAPADFLRALKTAGVSERWRALSYTHQREHVEALEEAKKPTPSATDIAASVGLEGKPPASVRPSRSSNTNGKLTNAVQAASSGCTARPANSFVSLRLSGPTFLRRSAKHLDGVGNATATRLTKRATTPAFGVLPTVIWVTRRRRLTPTQALTAATP